MNINTPVKDKRNILITSALPYVNNVPHLGNIIGCVLSADVFARYCRNQDYNVLYVCGTDEYGTATEVKAIEEKISCQELCDKYHKIHKEVYNWFQISFDRFGRTSTEFHTKISQKIFLKLYKNGYFSDGIVSQYFCNVCEIFLADRYLLGTCYKCKNEKCSGEQCDQCNTIIDTEQLLNPKCKICLNPPVLKNSNHLFFDLPKLQESVKKHCDNVYMTPNARSITNAWLKTGLNSRCITRDLKYGVPLPVSLRTEQNEIVSEQKELKDKIMFPWFDAPIGYISITGEKWKEWWIPEEKVELFQMFAKDNVFFHTLMFPASLIGTNDKYQLFTHINSTDYLQFEGHKFSKSQGLGIFGDTVMNMGIPSDIWRFYLIYIRPEDGDSNFTLIDFVNTNNSELVNNLGNFVNRTISLLSKNDYRLEVIETEKDEKEENKCECEESTRNNKFTNEINDEIKKYYHLMEQVKLRESLRTVFKISALGNKFLQEKAPWKNNLSHRPWKENDKLTITICVNLIYLLGILLDPFMPTTSKVILDSFGEEKENKSEELNKKEEYNKIKTVKKFELYHQNKKIKHIDILFKKLTY